MTCYFKVIFPLNIKDGFVYEYDSEIKKGVRVEVDLRGEKKIGIVWEKVENPLFETKKIKKIIDEEPLIEEGLMKSIQFTSSYYNAPLGMVIKSEKKLNFQKNRKKHIVKLAPVLKRLYLNLFYSLAQRVAGKRSFV
jgi:primosomal protein N'